ncbi:polysaccharide deacetylase family protein [Kribbella sp. NPDC051718]|uniref:polysaccharide deacetylase family protein n=1 Tax=Kribbella sp. NPDC051718 TaxID=3155168 RepID=UPI003447E1AC
MTHLLLAFGLIAVLGITPAYRSQVPAPAPRSAVAAKYVYLTFDDGPGPTYTPQVLAILRRYGVKATFFEIGQNVRKYPSVTRKVHLQGHSVQNHTYSHPDLRKVSAATFRSQVQSADRYIRAQTKVQPRCLRPPYGGVNPTVRRRAAALGKTIRLWTVDPRDWSRPGTSIITRRVLSSVRNGSTILLHDGGGNRSQTVAALPTILRTLKARGYTFRLVPC